MKFNILSPKTKEILEKFIPTIKNIIEKRKEEYNENNEEAIFQVLILLLNVVSVLISVTYSVFLKFDLNNILSKDNFLLFIDLIKSNMFVFVLRYISDKNLFKKMINNSDEINLAIIERLKMCVRFVSLYLVMLLFYCIYPHFNEILVLVMKYVILTPTIIFLTIHLIFIINDFIFFIIMKFLNKLNET